MSSTLTAAQLAALVETLLVPCLHDIVKPVYSDELIGAPGLRVAYKLINIGTPSTPILKRVGDSFAVAKVVRH